MKWMLLVLALLAAGGLVALFTLDPYGEKGSGLGDEFDYDLEKLRVTDPESILYEEVRTFSVDLAEPRALALSERDGETVIFVTGIGSVTAFGFDGRKRPGTIEFNGPAFNGTSSSVAATCLAAGPDGTLYVGLKDHIAVFGADGALRARWGPDRREQGDGLAHYTALAVAEDRIFAADFREREVHVYNLTGELLQRVGDFVIPSPYFDVALDGAGHLLAANTGEHRIEVYGPDGDLMSWWGRFSNVEAAGFSGCCNPVSLALLPKGDVITAEKGLTRVKRYGSDGAFRGFVAPAEAFARHDRRVEAPDYDLTRVALDLAVDESGRVVVLDPALAEIRIFRPIENTVK